MYNLTTIAIVPADKSELLSNILISNVIHVKIENKYRKKGKTGSLINQLINIAKENRCKKITLEVRKDNAKAQSLYTKLGFSESSNPMYFWNKDIN